MGTYSKLRHKKEIVPAPDEALSEVRHERSERVEHDERAESKKGKSQSKKKRLTKRKSYDLYIDQIKTLNTQTKIYFLLKGKQKNVTQMIREAIDEYIKKYQ